MTWRIVAFLNRIDERLGLRREGPCPSCGEYRFHKPGCPEVTQKAARFALLLVPVAAIAIVLTILFADVGVWIEIAATALVVCAAVPSVMTLVARRRRERERDSS